ncbi:MAG TPA: glycosyltransferase family 9 protein [Actinomycetota bacterium]|nr:glycosyltransferase family 9 protein [Actinomycetota bacterium]
MTPPARPPRALAYRALGLGDLLTAVPALRALRRAVPGHRLVLAAPAWLHPLARHTGAVDTCVAAAPLAPLPPAVAAPDVAVNLHGRGPQSHRVVLATRPRRLVAFAHPDVAESAGGARWDDDEHEVARWCRLLAGAGIPADASDLDLDPPPAPAPAGARGATLVHPGAASPARRWPVERWAAVVRAEADAGRRVIVTGGPGDAAVADAVAAAAGTPRATSVGGATDVVELAALVAAAARVACGDTGVAHLATALRTPSVVLFGPTPPSRWGPPPERTQHVALWAGRRGDPHAPEVDPGLLEIGVADVVAALATVGRAPRGARRAEEVGA